MDKRTTTIETADIDKIVTEAIAGKAGALDTMVKALKSVAKERDTYKRLDREAATHVESVICMRTDFSGDPPYVGWKGLGLALNEALDERDHLRKQVNGIVPTP